MSSDNRLSMAFTRVARPLWLVSLCKWQSSHCAAPYACADGAAAQEVNIERLCTIAAATTSIIVVPDQSTDNWKLCGTTHLRRASLQPTRASLNLLTAVFLVFHSAYAKAPSQVSSCTPRWVVQLYLGFCALIASTRRRTSTMKGGGANETCSTML